MSQKGRIIKSRQQRENKKNRQNAKNLSQPPSSAVGEGIKYDKLYAMVKKTKKLSYGEKVALRRKGIVLDTSPNAAAHKKAAALEEKQEAEQEKHQAVPFELPEDIADNAPVLTRLFKRANRITYLENVFDKTLNFPRAPEGLVRARAFMMLGYTNSGMTLTKVFEDLRGDEPQWVSQKIDFEPFKTNIELRSLLSKWNYLLTNTYKDAGQIINVVEGQDYNLMFNNNKTKRIYSEPNP